MQRTAVIRADASADVGLGHLVRSMTLGAALTERGWRVVLVAPLVPSEFAARARQASVEVHTLLGEPHGAADAATVLSLGPDLVIADGYRFHRSFYEAFASTDRLLCLIDDNGENVHPTASVIVNQNPSASPEQYGQREGDAELLLGLRYALVRPGVAIVANDRPDRNGVFVAMGGSDPFGLTETAVGISSRSGAPTTVSLGPAMRDREAVAARLRPLIGVTIVDDKGFVQALRTASLAIIGAGTTMWEAACLGTPSLAVVVAENQSAPARSAASLGFTVSFDARSTWAQDGFDDAVIALLNDEERRARMAQLGRAAVDGNGASRVAARLDTLIEAGRGSRC